MNQVGGSTNRRLSYRARRHGVSAPIRKSATRKSGSGTGGRGDPPGHLVRHLRNGKETDQPLVRGLRAGGRTARQRLELAQPPARRLQASLRANLPAQARGRLHGAPSPAASPAPAAADKPQTGTEARRPRSPALLRPRPTPTWSLRRALIAAPALLQRRRPCLHPSSPRAPAAVVAMPARPPPIAPHSHSRAAFP